MSADPLWVPVAKEVDMVPDRASVVRVGGVDVALVSTREGVFALDNVCPHSGGSLGEGHVEGGVVTCPLHGWQFECRTGKSLTEKRPSQRMFPVKIEGGKVFVQAPPDPPRETGERSHGDFVPVLEEARLAPGAVHKVEVLGKTVALVSTKDGVFALDGLCSHEGGPLAEGSLQGSTLVCPLHGYRFDASSGNCLTDRKLRQETYEVKVSGGKVFVRPREKSTAPDAGVPTDKKSPVEVWKGEKHGFEVWGDIVRHAAEETPMSKIDGADLERMKWYGFFYRKNNDNDHYMVRVRIPGCEMSSAQARGLATIAYQSGYNILDITTRGNVQIQGLRVSALPRVAAALEKVGLTSRQSGHDNVRNVTSHPLSGVDPDELIDTRALARDVQAMVIGDRELADLPRKVNVAITGRPDAPGHAWTQDISFIATQGPAGQVGFFLLIAGTQGQSPRMAWHLPVFVRPEEVVPVTRAILETFRELGHRHNRQQVRMRYLVERIGADGMLLEVEERLKKPLERFPHRAPKPRGEEAFVGWHAQKQPGLFALGVCVPVGRLTAEELDGLSAVARQYGDAVLRTTYDQSLVLTGIRAEAKEEVAYALARYGLTFEPDAASRSMVACTGKQFCNIAVIETKGYAYRLIEELRRRRVQIHGIRIAMSGCPSNCANGFTADIGLKGLKVRKGLRVLDAFDVFLGGGLGEELQMAALYRKAVPYEELPDAIEAIVREFHLSRAPGETFAAFWQRKLQRHRPEALKVEVPRWRCTRCLHLHVAQDPPPFCPMCAAVRAKFEPAVEGEAAEAEPTKAPERAAPPLEQKVPNGRRILVIGGGISGHTAAKAARAADPNARITLVAEERSFYNRLNLTRLLAREIEREAVFDYDGGWYAETGVELLSGARAIALDPVRKAVVLEEGRELEYDALVLANGSSAAHPPFYRDDLAGLVRLRTLADIEVVASRLKEGTRTVVIGGGVLGVEAALGARKRGANVCVLEAMARLMPRQLDTAAAALLTERLRGEGIDVETGVGIKGILGSDRVTGVLLQDDRSVAADLVIVSTGIRPNIDWPRRGGIRCGRGVIVDDSMRTSAPDIFAAGDLCEWRGQVLGLWSSAEEQAKVAGTCAAGQRAVYEGSVSVTSLKCSPLSVFSIGEIADDGGDVSSIVVEDEAQGSYKKVVFRFGLPIGAVLVGRASGLGELVRLVEGGRELLRLKERAFPEAAVPVHAGV